MNNASGRCIQTFAFFTLLNCISISVNAQFGCFPKQEGSKWGVAAEEEIYKKGALLKQDKWLAKPQWDAVWIDKQRYGCQLGRTCDMLLTLKNDKYGAYWCDGKQWPNEYDKLQLSSYCASKKGLWGGLTEKGQLLPFEYDTLIYLKNVRLYDKARLAAEFVKRNDTSYYYFIAKKNNQWQTLLVKQHKINNTAEVSPIGTPADMAVMYDNGVITQSKSEWQFIDLTNVSVPVYSQVYDSIKEVGALYGVKLKGKWSLVLPNYPNRPNMKAWDGVQATSVSSYIAVWENGLAGIMKFENNNLTEVFKPRGTDPKAYWLDGKTLRFSFNENGSVNVYNESGLLTSKSGDVTVRGSSLSGPFRIELHDEYGYCTVYDNATNTILIPKSKIEVRYETYSATGPVLYVKERNGYGYRVYQYKTKSYAEEKFQDVPKLLTNKFLIAKNYGSSNYLLLNAESLKPVPTPFTITDYTEKFGTFVKDQQQQWHELSDGFAVVPADKILLNKETLMPGAEAEEMMDHSRWLVKLNGQPLREKMLSSSYSETSKILTVSTSTKTTEYFEKDGKAVACNYAVPYGYTINSRITPNKPWPNESTIVPIALADSAGHYCAINMYIGKVIRFPFVVSGVGITNGSYTVKGSNFAVRTFSSTDYIEFEGNNKQVCTACKEGYISKKVKRTIKGGTTYKQVKTSTPKSETSSVWDPRTNSYKYVTKNWTEGGYDMVEEKQPDREVEETVTEVCGKCSGKGIINVGVNALWNGTSLQQK